MKFLNKIDFYTSLVQKIYEVHGDIQKAILKEFSLTRRKSSYEMLVKYKAFFVPSNLYLINIDNDCSVPNYGLYSGGHCMFNQRLVIPIWGFDGRVHSFVGYDDGKELKTDEERATHIYYLYQSRIYFNKDRYMLITPDQFQKAHEEQFICLVDGVFDGLTVNSLGYPTAPLLSSRFTEYHKKYLRYIKNWVLLMDNDDAGDMLESYAKHNNTHAIRLKFSGAKDIDEFINKSETNKRKFIESMEYLRDVGFSFDYTIA